MGSSSIRRLTRVSGHAERLAALDMIEPRADRPEAITLGGDKGFDAADFVMELREINVTPHIARNIEPPFRHRRPDDPSSRLCREPAHSQAHRGGLWLDEDHRWLQKNKISRDRKSRMGLHPCSRSLQPDPAAKVDSGAGVSAWAGCQLIGRWRILEADLWDRDYLDLVEPANITFNKNGRGEFAFGVVNATMELEYAKRIVFFTWTGFDEGERNLRLWIGRTRR